MSRATKPDVLDLFDQMNMAQLHAETLIKALSSCETLNGASDIDRVAFLDMVNAKQAEARQKSEALWNAIREVQP